MFPAKAYISPKASIILGGGKKKKKKTGTLLSSE